MYHRLRRASLRIRSCMTSFLKRLSKFSWDSPSRKLTVANTLTSFLIADSCHLLLCARHKKTGLRIMCWMATGSLGSGCQPQPHARTQGPDSQRPLHRAGGGLQALVHLHDVNSPRWNRKADPIAGQSSTHRCYNIITDSFAVVKASPDSELALACQALKPVACLKQTQSRQPIRRRLAPSQPKSGPRREPLGLYSGQEAARPMGRGRQARQAGRVRP